MRNYDEELECPLTYKMAPESTKAMCCNACGPQGWKFDVVPDNILGIDISEACNIHDWMYREGIETRQECDRIFKRNMKRLVNVERGAIRYWRHVLVWWYWRGVRRLGDSAYKGPASV